MPAASGVSKLLAGAQLHRPSNHNAAQPRWPTCAAVCSTAAAAVAYADLRKDQPLELYSLAFSAATCQGDNTRTMISWQKGMD